MQKAYVQKYVTVVVVDLIVVVMKLYTDYSVNYSGHHHHNVSHQQSYFITHLQSTEPISFYHFIIHQYTNHYNVLHVLFLDIVLKHFEALKIMPL